MLVAPADVRLNQGKFLAPNDQTRRDEKFCWTEETRNFAERHGGLVWECLKGVLGEDARLRPIRLWTIRLRPAGRNQIGRSRNWPKSKLAEVEHALFVVDACVCCKPVASIHVVIDFVCCGEAVHDSPRTPNVHISGPRCFKHHQNSTKRPQEKEERKLWREEGKKRANFWAPHPSGPHPSGPTHLGSTLLGSTLLGSTLLGSTLRGSTLLAPTLLGSTPSGPHSGLHPLSSQNSTSKNWPKSNWPKSKLAEVEIGQSQNWPKSKLAKVEIGRSRNWPKSIALVLGTPSAPLSAEATANLPQSMGGLGLTSALEVRTTAFWASWADSMKMVKERHSTIANEFMVGIDREEGPCFQSVRTCQQLLVDAGFVVPPWPELVDTPPRSELDPEPNQPKYGFGVQNERSDKLVQRLASLKSAGAWRGSEYATRSTMCTCVVSFALERTICLGSVLNSLFFSGFWFSVSFVPRGLAVSPSKPRVPHCEERPWSRTLQEEEWWVGGKPE